MALSPFPFALQSSSGEPGLAAGFAVTRLHSSDVVRRGMWCCIPLHPVARNDLSSGATLKGWRIAGSWPALGGGRRTAEEDESEEEEGLPHVGPVYHAALAVKDERCALAAEAAAFGP